MYNDWSWTTWPAPLHCIKELPVKFHQWPGLKTFKTHFRAQGPLAGPDRRRQGIIHLRTSPWFFGLRSKLRFLILRKGFGVDHWNIVLPQLGQNHWTSLNMLKILHCILTNHGWPIIVLPEKKAAQRPSPELSNSMFSVELFRETSSSELPETVGAQTAKLGTWKRKMCNKQVLKKRH